MLGAGLVPSAGTVEQADPSTIVLGDAPFAAPPDGEGLLAEITNLHDVASIAIHPWTSEIYWTDHDTHRVRRVDLDGRTWTVAGTGTEGFSGDGGPADQARLHNPGGIAFDGDGNLYIADSFNHRIRRVDTLGFITTVAGGGDQPTGTSAGFAALTAELQYPADVAVPRDGSYFLIADSGNHQVHRVNSGGVLFTIAGSTQGFSGDNGQAVDAQLSFPEVVELSPSERWFYISDVGNQRLRVYQDGIIITAAGNGTVTFDEGAQATLTGVGAIRGIAVDAGGVVYLSDHATDTVRRLGTDGRLTTVTGQGTGAFGTAAFQGYLEPTGLAVDEFNRLLVGDAIKVSRIGSGATRLPIVRPNPYGRPAEDQVKRLYRAGFGRHPDPAGLQFWVRRYQADDTMQSLAANFLASDESRALYGADPTDEEFLTVLYDNVLRRGPDSGGLAFWLDQLNSGRSRASVLAAFADSDENMERTRTAPAMTAVDMEVLRLYRAAFGRVPDSGGLSYWTAQRRGGVPIASIAASFIASPEASGYLDNPEDDLFLEALYGNVLGRNADAEGLAFWLGELRTGRSRTNVLVQFSESTENRRRTGTA